MDSPSLDARVPSAQDDDDDSGLLDFNAKLDDLSIEDSPLSGPGKVNGGGDVVRGAVKAKKVSRPSWGPPLPGDGEAGKGKMRLLDGLEDSSAATNTSADDRSGSLNAKKEKSLGGIMAGGKAGSKPRFSLFAKPSYLDVDAGGGGGTRRRGDEEEEGGDDEGDESIRLGKERDDDFFRTQAQQQQTSGSRGEDATEPTPARRGESKEQVQNQLRELKMMNEVFEAYEAALRGGANQIDVSSSKTMEALLLFPGTDR